MKILEINGIKFLNATNHTINIDDNDKEFVIESSYVLDASFESETFTREEFPGITFNKSKVVPTKEGIAFIESVPDDVLIIASKIAVDAYKDTRVVGVTPAKGFERVPYNEKKMSSTVFYTCV